MAQIKHTFTTGRMNKDLDERLVPNGEYRDALNIQIRTTDGGAGGTVQSLQGNESKGIAHLTTNLSDQKTKCIGSVADERNNKGYFLFASPDMHVPLPAVSSIIETQFYVDSIIEQDSDGSYNPVVVDVFGITKAVSPLGFTSLTSHTTIPEMSVTDASTYRVGMVIKAYTFTDASNLVAEGTKVAKISGNTIYLDRPQASNLSTAAWFSFEAPRALEFNYNSRITGINVIDDFLFYTDDISEPKKINIRRSKKGTTSPQNATTPTHTNLVLKSKSGVLQNESDYVGTIEPVTKEHFTVIRKAPRTAPALKLKSSIREGSTSYTITGQDFTTGITTNDGVSTVFIPKGGIGVELFSSDVVKLTCTNDTSGTASTIRGSIVVSFGDYYILQILSISTDVLASHSEWIVELEQPGKPLFELKFPRFAFRYKYNDNEYSSFSPWSEIAFIPGKFDYNPKKGHNLGMTNLLRELTITNLLQDTKVRPDDIKCIDILYKSTDSANVYVVKTVEKGIDPEWSNIAGSTNSSDVIITSEMIHKTVPSDQILRSWDNVPRLAKAQEIVGNRLIYGNYTQGYDMSSTVAINQSIISKDLTTILNPEKSIKSLRSYKFGLVIGDEYGRETPVISVGNRTETNPGTTISQLSDSTSINKSEASKSNKFLVTQDWVSSQPDSWMDYAKYYVKETSSEYYNLIMDRWYDASDGNIWVSFPSAERNKVDDETYLILKNKNGEESAVQEEARYKVIAIENEAPDFIKRDKRNVGSVPVEAEDINYSPTDVPNGLMETLSFSLANDTSLGNYDFKGSAKVRIKAFDGSEYLYTSYKDITKFSPHVGSDTEGEINIELPFGSEANFPQILVSLGLYATVALAKVALETDGNGYTLEFRDEIIENKPEFDGRFFVKLERDLVLEENVMTDVDLGTVYTVEQSYNFAYIDTSSVVNPADEDTLNPNVNQFYNYSFNPQGADFNATLTDFATASTGGAYPQPEMKSWYYYYAGQTQVAQDAVYFIDNARYENTTNNDFPYIPVPTDWYGQTSRGFAKSGNADINHSTYDRLFFSRSTISNSESSQFEFETKMKAAGTYFRFTNDPNRSVYRTTGESENSNVNLNMTHPSSSAAQRLSAFYTTFKRVSTYSSSLTNEGIDFNAWDPRGDMAHDGTMVRSIEILSKVDSYGGSLQPSSSAAVFETEPKDSVDLDLYYEASNAIPLRLNDNNTSEFAPLKSKVSLIRHGQYLNIPESEVDSIYGAGVLKIVKTSDGAVDTTASTAICVNDILEFEHSDGTKTRSRINNWVDVSNNVIQTIPHRLRVRVVAQLANQEFLTLESGNCESNGIVSGMTMQAISPGLSQSVIVVADSSDNFFTVAAGAVNNAGTYNIVLNTTGSPLDYSTYISLDKGVYKYQVELPWFNCYSFGNGVESNRIRDDFNTPFINNGVKVSSNVDDYQKEERYNSLIYSNIYNANSSVNGLNEFNMSQKITKDLNPSYGKVQALKTRDTDITVFTEDKVLRVLANKDALFNADGSTNVTASDRVLGQAVPYVGDYGISNNPESLAFDQYRMYFTDKQRGAVLRLSRDGLTPISNIGMNNWFRDHLKKSSLAVGSFDKVNGEYNVSIDFEDVYQLNSTTVSFNEQSKGWVSFKTFIQESGQSFGGEYFTSKQGKVWKHYSDQVLRNSFYNTSTNSSINVIINELPGVVKNFEAINYEGSEGYRGLVNNRTYSDEVTASAVYNDGEFEIIGTNPNAGNMQTINGWKASSIVTDMETGQVSNFHTKEGKWFGYITGDFDTNNITVDEGDFATQGLGFATSVSSSSDEFEITIQEGE